MIDFPCCCRNEVKSCCVWCVESSAVCPYVDECCAPHFWKVRHSMSSSWFTQNETCNTSNIDTTPEDVPKTFTTDQAHVLAEDDKLSTCSTQPTMFADSIDGVEVLGAPPPQTFVEWNSRWSGRIVEDARFKRAIIVLIMLNSIALGIGTFDFANENVKRLFHVLDYTFLIVFSGEVILQALHHKVNFFSDGWLLYDTVIVAFSWFMPFLLVLRAFRLIRTLRLATRIQPLKSVSNALLRAVPKLFSVTFLLSIFFYIFAVLFATLYKDLHEQGVTSEDCFSRMDETLFTLFRIMTLDNWAQTTQEVMEAFPWAWMPFLAFVMSASLVLANLTIAVLCESMFNVHNEKQEGKRVQEEKYDSPPSTQVAQHVARLEGKIDELTLKLELLLRSKGALHDDDEGEVSLE